MSRRQAFDIRFRCTLTGCDWTARLFLKSSADAFEAMYRRLAFSAVRGGDRPRNSRAFYRVVLCEVSADQSRPIA
ncbi:hypothetical protein MA20_42980 [Bradyrhizobium japonicum]|uniref:Uncharacterized protein n=1 Tax=Bradyrhizobium japonicum TaxID=375 RepID=A0A0A3XHC8_BRAJP|nr:hypothetical protein MA20_42980 [Bradyrhizobium japonicum]